MQHTQHPLQTSLQQTAWVITFWISVSTVCQLCISIFNWCSLGGSYAILFWGNTICKHFLWLHLKIELFSCVSKTKDSSRLFQRIQIFKGSFINTKKKTHIQWLRMLHLSTLKFIMSAKLKSGKLRKIENFINNKKRGNIKIYSTHTLTN